MRLRITPKALAELDEILLTISDSSPKAAGRVSGCLQDAVDRILAFPKSGQATNRDGLRRYLARPFPDLIFYLAGRDEIVVVAYRHAARDPSSMPG